MKRRRLTAALGTCVACCLPAAVAIPGLGSTAVAAPAAPAHPPADFDNDGIPDLVVGFKPVNVNGYATWIRFGNGTEDRVSGLPLSVGDFNGDGYDDLVVSRNYAQSSSMVLFDGGPTGLSPGIPTGTNRCITNAPVERAGDFNGDGMADLVCPSGNDTGSVIVRYGSSTGPGSPVVINRSTPGIPGSARRGDRFGFAVSTGDVTGDGRDDLAIITGPQLATDPSTYQHGRVFVVPGSFGGLKPGLTTSARLTLKDRSPWSVAVGDTNADGHADVVVGLPEAVVKGRTNAGRIRVLRGATGGIDLSNGFTLTQATTGVAGRADQYDLFGRNVALADISGDGKADLVVGVPGESVIDRRSGRLRRRAGAAEVFLGGRFGPRAATSTVFTQSSPHIPGRAETGDEFGLSIAFTDRNLDGLADAVLMAPYDSFGTSIVSGRGVILRGSSTGLTTDVVVQLRPDLTTLATQAIAFGLPVGG